MGPRWLCGGAHELADRIESNACILFRLRLPWRARMAHQANQQMRQREEFRKGVRFAAIGQKMHKGKLTFALVALACWPAAAEPSCGLYQYRATITEVYDGDTVTADIDLGFNTWRRNEHLRLDGIDTPELRGPRKVEGFAARDALAKRILGRELVICTIKDRQEKFGRYLVKIYDGDVLVNDWLIEAGHGVAYSGGKRQP